LLAALDLAFESRPVFMAAARPGEFNTAVTVSGLLYVRQSERRVLLTGAALPSAVTDMLSSKGIDVVVW
jgi:hypothetical protein